MSKAVERIERSILYTTLLFLTVFPAYTYIYPIGTRYSLVSSIVIVGSGILAILYTTLCLCYRGFVDLHDLVDPDASVDAKGCQICMQFKPERAHHCSSCKKCIKKMDHHCHWLGRCINYDNHGHFIRFLFFTFINAFALCAFNSYYLYFALVPKSIEVTYTSAIVLAFSILISSLLVVVTYFHLNAQLYMVAKNVTFIESLHCRNFDYSVDESPYNFGINYNIQEVLGPFYQFLLGMPKGNGIFFKKRYKVNYWPKHVSFSDRMYMEVI